VDHFVVYNSYTGGISTAVSRNYASFLVALGHKRRSEFTWSNSWH